MQPCTYMPPAQLPRPASTEMHVCVVAPTFTGVHTHSQGPHSFKEALTSPWPLQLTLVSTTKNVFAIDPTNQAFAADSCC